MVAVNNFALWSRMWSYKDHGKSWEAVYEREHPPGFRWVHDSFGPCYQGSLGQPGRQILRPLTRP